jgi:hypothetical protein
MFLASSGISSGLRQYSFLLILSWRESALIESIFIACFLTFFQLVSCVPCSQTIQIDDALSLLKLLKPERQ